MWKKSEVDATLRRVIVQAPSAAACSAHQPGPGGLRSLVADAALCFFATALGSLAPQALNLLDFAPQKPLAFHIDPQSGKFTDRILVGGLRPLSWDDESARPAPAFLVAPAPPSVVDLLREDVPRQMAAAIKPAKEAATTGRRVEKAIEKAAPATPAPPIRHGVEPVVSQARSEAAEEGMSPPLTPSSVSSRLAPVGQKLWSGAKSLGDAMIGSLSWLGY
jgi:hypothetical protein